MYDGGSTSITAVLNSAVTLTIPFNKTFANPPAFVCQIETGQVTADKMTIKSVTNKRAEVFLYTSSASHAVKYTGMLYLWILTYRLSVTA